MGNVVLKLTEGVAGTLLGMLKDIFMQSIVTKLCYLGVKGGLRNLKHMMDSEEIGGGLPVAAYGGKREIMQMVSPAGPMYQAGTLSGNPLAMAAGIAALTYMEQNDVCNRAESLCAILTGGLEKAAAKAGVPVQIHRLGSMFTVFFSDKPVTDFDSAAASDLEAFKIYFHSMLEQGIYLPPSQFETNFVSIAHSPEDLQKTIDAAEIAFAEVAKARK